MNGTATSYLCGCLGVGDPRATLARLHNGTVPDDTIFTTDAGLHAGGPTASIQHTDGLLVACIGHPDWHGETALRVRHGSDAATIAALYREHGHDALGHLHGEYALAILDSTRRRALLAIDRVGIHSLCHATPGDGLVFATRADRCASAAGPAPQHDPQAIYDYLFHHVVPAPRTIFRGVRKLPPGHYAEWHDGRLHEGHYWRLHYEEPRGGDLSALGVEFRGLLHDAVARRLDGGKTGAFLSGGTDSSTVAGYLAQVEGGSAPTYSIGFDVAGYDESDYAELSARHFGTAHHSYRMTPDDVLAALPRVAGHFDEPFGNASVVAAYRCARLAREDGITTLLAGDGGDELFAGNARYASQRIFECYGHIPRLLRAGLIEPLARMSLAPRKLASYVQQARVPLPDRLESYNFLLREIPVQIFTPEFLAGVDTDAPLAALRDIYHGSDAHTSLNRMLWLDLKITLADNDLRKVNGACALAGVAVRYPLLDEALLDFSAHLPPGYKLRGGQLRWFFKEALRDVLPPETLAKKKHGFGLPFGRWLREHHGLRALTDDVINNLARRGIVRADYLTRLRARHADEHADYYGVMIWVLMMLELWLSVRVTSQDD